jgi:hypothetical protein
MNRPLTTLLCVLALAVASLACRKIEDPPFTGGEINVMVVPLSDTIPSDFGQLVGTSSGGGWTQLVFERADRAIVIVSISVARENIADRVFIIPRK